MSLSRASTRARRNSTLVTFFAFVIIVVCCLQFLFYKQLSGEAVKATSVLEEKLSSYASQILQPAHQNATKEKSAVTGATDADINPSSNESRLGTEDKKKATEIGNKGKVDDLGIHGKDSRPAGEKKKEANHVGQESQDTKDANVGTRRQDFRLAGLSCDKWGGPPNSAAEEMIYWKDIPADSQIQSPFHKTGGKTQYFTFEPDFAGFNNVRMSMETVSSAALAMGRTLVLPPAQELHMLSSSDDEQKDEFSFNDFFPMESISREHEGFSIITMEQYLNLFLEGKLKHPHTGESIFPPNNRTNWNGCSMNDFEILKSWLRKSSKRLKVSDTACLLSFPRSSNSTATEEMDQLQYGIKQKSKIGWSSFIGKPTPVDAAPKDRLRENLASRSSLCVYDRELQEAPWLHFPVIKDPADASRMLVHFYAFLFFADWKMDLWTKRFVRDHLRYVDELQCTAARIVNAIRKRVLKRTAGKIEEFDTMHVRRGDFQSQYSFSNSTAEDIYKMTRQRIPDNTTVYIATDERNKTFFDPMKQHYEILFLDDFKMELKGINSNFYGMIDQLVASRGRVFFGCWPSTFTGYINRLRGYHADNKKSPEYEKGIIPSYYYSPSGNFLNMQTFYPVKPKSWTREFPTSWRLIDTGVVDAKNTKSSHQ